MRWEYWQSQDELSSDCPEPVEVDVGSCLRRLREKRGFSLRVLSEKSGLAINTLSLIENGKSSPSVSTLQQLAGALEVPITSLFENHFEESRVAFVKKERRPRANFEQGILEDLGAGSSIQAVEPFVVTQAPATTSGVEKIVHTGYEFVYCLEGRVAYSVDDQTYILEPGDSILFEAYLPHHWQNFSSSSSKWILILFPSDQNDRPTERHFYYET